MKTLILIFVLFSIYGCGGKSLHELMPSKETTKQYFILKGVALSPLDIKAGYLQFDVVLSASESEEEIPCFIHTSTTVDEENERLNVELKELVCNNQFEDIKGYTVDKDFKEKGVPFECEDEICSITELDHNLIILGDSKIVNKILKIK
jgi:hypothetical protein